LIGQVFNRFGFEQDITGVQIAMKDAALVAKFDRHAQFTYQQGCFLQSGPAISLAHLLLDLA